MLFKDDNYYQWQIVHVVGFFLEHVFYKFYRNSLSYTFGNVLKHEIKIKSLYFQTSVPQNRDNKDFLKLLQASEFLSF